MLVGLALGLMVMLAVMVVQVNATNQNMRVTDSNQRDNEVRAALDLLTQDISSSGFLLSPAVPNCAARLNYDSAAPSPYYFLTTPVSALASSNGLALPFVVSGGLTMDYPATGSTNRSDVLVISRAADATQYGDAASPTTTAVANVAFHPGTTGQLPVSSTSQLSAGHVGLVMVPLAGSRLCLRVPISTTASSSSAYITATGALMPSGYYANFSSNLASAGFSAGSLVDSVLMQGKVVDLGTAAASNQLSYVYYVSSSAYTWPTLMRATVNTLNDTVTRVQPIAAGVVSLQVLFGVDGSGSGAVTAYETGATLATNNDYANIRSVRVGLVVRSLYGDQTYTAPATITIPGSSGSVPFTSYTVPSSASTMRHTAQTTELAVRNTLWTP